MEFSQSVNAGVRLDEAKHAVVFGRKMVSLTRSEWKVFSLLWEHKGQIVSRGDLLKGLWKDDKEAPTRVVDVHISNIRGKILPLKALRIDSFYGCGYRLVEVRR